MYCVPYPQAPAVAVHVFQSDEEMWEQGFGQANVVCHSCRQGWFVQYPAVTWADTENSPLEPIMLEFLSIHEQHKEADCGLARVTRYLDLCPAFVA